MTSLPGGAADKAGNRYEHWWTALRAADVSGRSNRFVSRVGPAAPLAVTTVRSSISLASPRL